MNDSTIDSGSKPLLVGIVTGTFVSVVITVSILVWEWLENPGGIYHDDTGTDFGIVFETAASWLIPLFLGTAFVATIVHLVWSGMRRRRSQDQNQGIP